MTTSYELSLRLKELGSPQVGGEYYWVEVAGYINCYHYTETPCLAEEVGNILCRALTLGELVRMLVKTSVKFELVHFLVYTVYLKDEHDMSNGLFKRNTSPEEAAGELLAEILSQEKQKA